MATTLLPEAPLHPLGQEYQPQLIHTLQQSQPRQKHHLRPRPRPQPQRHFMFQLPSHGQSEVLQPTHAFSVWLSQQGMTPRFGQAVARYLGIRDLADLRACAEEPSVRAEFLDAARRFLPFASYVALRRLVKMVTPPSQPPPPPCSPEKDHIYPSNSILNTFEEGEKRETMFKREEERCTQMKRNKRGRDFEGHDQDCNGKGGSCDQGWTQTLACSLLQAIVEMLTSLGQELLHSATTFSRLQPTPDTEERSPSPQDFPPGEEIMEDGVMVDAREGPADALAACAENEENRNWDNNEEFIDEGYMHDSKAAVCPEDENHESMIKTESDLDQETGFPDALVGWVPEMAGWTAAEGNGWDREGERLGHEISTGTTSEWTPNTTGLSEQGQSSTFAAPSTIPAVRSLPSGSRPKQKSRPAFTTSLHTGPGLRPKPFACILCGERFTHASGLSRHKRIHAEKPYKCDMCGKEFLLAYTLIRHSRMHT